MAGGIYRTRHSASEREEELGMSEPPLIQLVEATDFLARESSDEHEYLVEELIPAHSQTIWQGRPKVGKSHSLLQLAYNAAIGLPVFSRFKVPRPVRTCFIELEEPEGLTKKRFENMLCAHDWNIPDSGMLWFLSLTDLHRLRLLPRELLYQHRQGFFRVLGDAGIEMIIIVALRRLLSGDFNDPTVAEALNDALDELSQETGVALLLGNHTRKSGAATAEARGFGSTMFAARADAIFDFSRAKGNTRRVIVEARYDAPHDFFLCKERVGEGEIVRVVGDPEEEKKRELATRIAQGKSLRQAAKEAGVPYTSAYRLVNG
jgi:RecA-family ATPase